MWFIYLQIEEEKKLFQNQFYKWITNPTWTSAKHEVEPKCLTLPHTVRSQGSVDPGVLYHRVPTKAFSAEALSCSTVHERGSQPNKQLTTLKNMK